MAGIKGQKGGGGARPHSGPKPKAHTEALREMMSASWSISERKASIAKMKQIASGDDNAAAVSAWRALMSYAYGTPPSGDELKLQENVDVEIENILTKIEESVSPSAWREVCTSLGIGPRPIESAGRSRA